MQCLLEIGSDISIIDESTWKKIGRPKLLNTIKVARGVSGNKLKSTVEFNASVSFGGKTYNSKVYVVPRNNSCLFGIYWMVLFDWWDVHINSFCNKLDAKEKKKSWQIKEFLTDPKERIFSSIFWGFRLLHENRRFEIKKKNLYSNLKELYLFRLWRK